MSRFLYRLGSLAYRHAWPFLAFWLIVLTGLGIAVATVAQQPSPNFSMPSMDSTDTQERMQERFARDKAAQGEGTEEQDFVSAPEGTVVIQSQDAPLTAPEVMAEVDALVADMQATGVLANPETVVNPVMAAAGMEQQMREQLAAQGMPEEKIRADLAAISPLSEDEHTGTISLTFDAATAMAIAPEDREAITSLVDAFDEQPGFQAGYSGNAFMGEMGMDPTAEMIGLAVAAIVLLVTFGSAIAAGIPLISAIVGVATGLLIVMSGTALTDAINDMTPVLASMIGLAVGIDYSLFILSRFRNELITVTGTQHQSPKDFAQTLRGLDKPTRAHAMGMALGTAGGSVIFAGVTVLIALAALSIIDIPFLTAMALAAAGTVALAVLVALTFLPAMVGLLGSKIFALRIPGPKVPDPENDNPTMGLRWARQIRKRPILNLLVGVVMLGILAIPAAQLQLAMPTEGQESPGSPQRNAYEMTAEAFGDGRNAPMLAYIDATNTPAEQRPQLMQEAMTTFTATDGVVNAQVVDTTAEADGIQMLITPTTGATDEETTDTLERLRENQAHFAEQYDAEFGITGIAPIFDDISQLLTSILIPYILIVLGLAFIVLVLVFRSILVPLIAAAGYALSVAATFGLTVFIFQEGGFGIVSDPQPILSFLPIMLIGLTFGLAMDYQVFLVTRMRENFVRVGKTAGNATANGFKHGARVVTAAALIMISVFAAFMLLDEPFIRTMGFALAVAILLDAFIVRMTLVPATMYLLGNSAWWFPRWLDKILPRLDIEGEALEDDKEKLLARTEKQASDD
ncbi:MMPL family transporter [Corynebacterium pseudodiphtheriticum]|uniref:MMPL family transporter n=1 Tax=Corynebacterium pseudodiphtheriticum TaxID=37637 RepID=A0ABT7FVC8_9CORY|nr:MMPL family transporter [Corynebacterium pseudodiphtheriticum]MDK4207492.1 MMPL family transporter [Corynebacterium pseudodiphtheriticum]MDK4284034.1 MMPL family transporter [Corynebacterium pseudodiphtheriticum]MDK4289934.1 MMPL family transporter [Corynebacterium pseudodiphtheriticum]MDK8396074.1 MMPL family transporter [Corynebacterium pseudodiphtheriticum]